MKISPLAREAEKVINALWKTYSPYGGGVYYTAGEVIFTAGNGGSASIANHMACDWMKSTYKPGKKAIRVISLASNTVLLTALGNDCGYDETFSRQLQWLAKSGHAVVLISSSGTSKNIVKAAEEAKRLGCKLVGFTGNAGNSDGGLLRKWADVSVHTPLTEYGQIEDFHSQVMHEIVRQLKEKL